MWHLETALGRWGLLSVAGSLRGKCAPLVPDPNESFQSQLFFHSQFAKQTECDCRKIAQSVVNGFPTVASRVVGLSLLTAAALPRQQSQPTRTSPGVLSDSCWNTWALKWLHFSSVNLDTFASLTALLWARLPRNEYPGNSPLQWFWGRSSWRSSRVFGCVEYEIRWKMKAYPDVIQGQFL